MDTIDIIIKLLKQKGVSGAQMSKDLGFSNAVFSQWNQRKQSPSADKLQKMASYFNVSMDYLLGKTLLPRPQGVFDKIETNLKKYEIDPASMRKGVTFSMYGKYYRLEGMPPEALRELDQFMSYLKYAYGSTPLDAAKADLKEGDSPAQD